MSFIVVGFILKPVKPFQLLPCLVPGPVAIVVGVVVACGSGIVALWDCGIVVLVLWHRGIVVGVVVAWDDKLK